MPIQNINPGAAANDGTGTPARTAAQLINSNFTYLQQLIINNNKSVENRYVTAPNNDTAYMISDQVNQTDGKFQYVADSTDDPNYDAEVDTTDAYYEYLGTTVGDITDYRRLSDNEVTAVILAPSYRTATVKAIETSYVDDIPAAGELLMEYSGSNVTYLYFNAEYSKYFTGINAAGITKLKLFNKTNPGFSMCTLGTATVWQTNYIKVAVTGLAVSNFTVLDVVELFEDLAGASESSGLVAKTGTNIVFTENAEYYADGSYNPNTSGDIVLDLTGAVEGAEVAVFVSGYTPNITGASYKRIANTSNGNRDIYYFYKAFEGLKLSVIGQGVLTTPVVTLTPADEEITIDWTVSVGATSYTVLRNTSNTTTGATTIYTGALLTFNDTGLTNGTTYYYFVQATGSADDYDSDYGTNSDAPEAYGADAYVFYVKTDNAGTSSSTQYTVPTSIGGTYNCTVDWGDGNTDTITTYNDAAWTHTYSTAGTYRVIITGATFRYSAFGNGGDKLKLLSVEQFGLFKPASSSGLADNTYYGCSNLVINATDSPDWTDCTTANGFFRACSSITTIVGINTWTCGSVQQFNYFFRDCTSLTQDLSGMNISGATGAALSQFLYQCTSFNNNLPTATTTGNTTFQQFLYGATSFNQDISVLTYTNVTVMQSFLDGATSFNHISIESIDTSNVSSFGFCLRSTTALDRSLANWDVRAAAGGVGFMDNTSISQANYDATLIGWDTRTGYTSGNWDFNTSQYTAAGAGGTARASLITKGLTFTDVAN